MTSRGQLHRRALKRLKRWDSVAAALRLLRFELAGLRGKEPVIIYQMGKVGSSTVAASLKMHQPGRPLYHIHTLTRRGLAASQQAYASLPRPPGFARSKHLLASQYLLRQLGAGRPGRRWKVVTLVREPIARNISSFFQLIDVWLPNFVRRHQAGLARIEEAIRTFLDHYHHDEPLNWFDRELNPVLGVDVFGRPFPHQHGYDILSGARADVLVLRLESLNACAPAAFAEFLGIESFQLVHTNVASRKDYHGAYRDFLNAVRLPAEYVERMYASRYVQHFYPPADIDRFRAKWSQAYA